MCVFVCVCTGVAEAFADTVNTVTQKASTNVTDTFRQAWNVTNQVAHLGAGVGDVCVYVCVCVCVCVSVCMCVCVCVCAHPVQLLRAQTYAVYRPGRTVHLGAGAGRGCVTVRMHVMCACARTYATVFYL